MAAGIYGEVEATENNAPAPTDHCTGPCCTYSHAYQPQDGLCQEESYFESDLFCANNGHAYQPQSFYQEAPYAHSHAPYPNNEQMPLYDSQEYYVNTTPSSVIAPLENPPPTVQELLGQLRELEKGHLAQESTISNQVTALLRENNICIGADRSACHRKCDTTDCKGEGLVIAPAFLVPQQTVMLYLTKCDVCHTAPKKPRIGFNNFVENHTENSSRHDAKTASDLLDKACELTQRWNKLYSDTIKKALALLQTANAFPNICWAPECRTVTVWNFSFYYHRKTSSLYAHNVHCKQHKKNPDAKYDARTFSSILCDAINKKAAGPCLPDGILPSSQQNQPEEGPLRDAEYYKWHEAIIKRNLLQLLVNNYICIQQSHGDALDCPVPCTQGNCSGKSSAMAFTMKTNQTGSRSILVTCKKCTICGKVPKQNTKSTPLGMFIQRHLNSKHVPKEKENRISAKQNCLSDQWFSLLDKLTANCLVYLNTAGLASNICLVENCNNSAIWRAVCDTNGEKPACISMLNIVCTQHHGEYSNKATLSALCAGKLPERKSKKRSNSDLE